jgi:peptidoglycan/xylan/chitin deacetylase (PgdA/CDA1 family)
MPPKDNLIAKATALDDVAGFDNGYAINPMRWYLKKAARKACIGLSSLNTRNRRKSIVPNLRVLAYHRFSEDKLDPVAVSPKDFEQQLRWLSANVDVLDAESFKAVMNGQLTLQRDAVLITVDDGHRSFFEHAYPLLVAFNIPALLFVCPALIDHANSSGEFMGWEDIRQVSLNGITVASHGDQHISLGKLSVEQAKQEAINAQNRLKQCVNADHSFFAFPFGTRQDFSAPIGAMLLSLGYQFCFSSIHGKCEPVMGTNIFPRVKIESGESLQTFIAIVKGYLDSWRLVDDSASWIQQRGRF